jgi:uncharacterized Tic20 family protein
MTMTDLDRELEQMANAELRREAQGEPASSSTTSTATTTSRALPARAPRRGPSSPAAFRGADEAFPHDERNLAMGVHIGTLCTTLFSGGMFLPLLVPLVARAVLKDATPALREHMRQQLNFQLTVAVVAVVGGIGSIMTLGLGLIALIPVLLFLLAVEVVASVKGAIAASNGEQYTFPFSIEMVKPDADAPRGLLR